MSTDDQTHSGRLHGEALLAAQDETFQPLLDRLAKVAEGRDDLRAEVAGTLAGTWFARPDGHQGHELIAAGLLILAGVTDRGEVVHWTRIGYERGHGSLEWYAPRVALDSGRRPVALPVVTEDGRKAVVKWLRESGYPLEMRLTTACLQSGLTTNSSFPYRDPVESGKVREADILVTLAFHWSPSGAVWVMRNVIECKSPGKPWVALMPTLTQLDPATALTPDDLVSLGDDHDVILPWLEQAWVEALASNAVPMASNLVTAHAKDDQLNNAMSALRQTLSAAYGLHAATGAGPAGVTMLTVPALVTSGELLSAHLDASGEPLVEDLDHVWVRVRHPIGVSSVYVHVMTEVYFVDRFVPALRGIQREGPRRSVRV